MSRKSIPSRLASMTSCGMWFSVRHADNLAIPAGGSELLATGGWIKMMCVGMLLSVFPKRNFTVSLIFNLPLSKADFNETQILMKLRYYKRSAVISVSRIIPEANNLNTQRAPWGHYRLSGIIAGLIPRPLRRKFLWIPR